jgi:hypothetical protein
VGKEKANILVGKTDLKGDLERPSRGREGDIKMNLIIWYEYMKLFQSA